MRQERTTGLRKVQPIVRAASLIAEHRVRPCPSAEVYLVDGDHGSYRVIAAIDGIFCPCEARTPLCAHVLAVAQLRQSENCSVMGGVA